MKILSTLSTLLAGFALVQASQESQHDKRQCWVDRDGSSHCNNEPKCTTHPDGTKTCVV